MAEPSPIPNPALRDYEYEHLQRLLDAASAGKDITPYGGLSLLYVDQVSGCILDASSSALDLLGYSREELLSIAIEGLETTNPADTTRQIFTETSIEEQIYPAHYRHRSGEMISVQVSRRLVLRGGMPVVCYRLQDFSLYSRVWRELRRREDDGFQFQQKLKALNEVTIALSLIDSHDLLCQQVIALGIQQLGFDRLSIWFLDTTRNVMTGCYGVDEHGQLRDEYDQQWNYDNTYVMKFLEGHIDAAIAYDDAPLYNEKSEIIDYGAHIAAPVLHGKRVIGILMADNLLRSQPTKSYEPELLRQYGMTVGHLTELVRTREQAFALRLQRQHTQMLQQFIANVGHDFKTPLASISLKSYLMQRSQEAAPRETLADGIQQQVSYITITLDRMLDFIEYESSANLTPAPVSLAALVSVVVDTFRSALEEKRIQCDVPDSGPTVNGDTAFLQRALSEILDNAIRYSPEDERITISLTQYPDRVGISIKDQGPGIGSADTEKIFVPLYRTDRARTDRRSGLGLAIAKTIVEAHAGQITVTSTPGQGSLFEITLPASSSH